MWIMMLASEHNPTGKHVNGGADFRFTTDLPAGVCEMNQRLVEEAEAGDLPTGSQVPMLLLSFTDYCA